MVLLYSSESVFTEAVTATYMMFTAVVALNVAFTRNDTVFASRKIVSGVTVGAMNGAVSSMILETALVVCYSVARTLTSTNDLRMLCVLETLLSVTFSMLCMERLWVTLQL